MQTRTELLKIAAEIEAIATRTTVALTVAELDQLNAQCERLDIVISNGMNEAVLEAFYAADRRSAQA